MGTTVSTTIGLGVTLPQEWYEAKQEEQVTKAKARGDDYYDSVLDWLDDHLTENYPLLGYAYGSFHDYAEEEITVFATPTVETYFGVGSIDLDFWINKWYVEEVGTFASQVEESFKQMATFTLEQDQLILPGAKVVVSIG